MAAEFVQMIAAECLVGRVRSLSRVVSGIFDGKLRPYGIRSSQINILTIIAAKGPLSPSEVCRNLCLDRSTLSRDLDRLVEHGWVSSTPGEGRVLRLEITGKGRDLIHKIKPAWDDSQAEIETLLGASLVKELYRAAEEGRLGESEKHRRRQGEGIAPS